MYSPFQSSLKLNIYQRMQKAEKKEEEELRNSKPGGNPMKNLTLYFTRKSNE